jgi:3-oxoacyl-[acyl-carrier protein] reductase
MGDASEYADRVVVVTGARKGLGQVLANHFLAGGAKVVGISRGEASIEHPEYSHFAADVGDDAAVREVFIQIARSFGRVDIVVNNAAVLTSMHAMLMPATRAEEMIRTNVLGVLYVSREAAKLMRKSKWGRIINIGSMASTLEPVGDSMYAASKSASLTLTGVLAKEFASYGVTVNTLAVTAFETDMLDQLPREKVDAVIAGLPLARYPTTEDITNVVDFFASPRSAYITAQTLYLGGVHR